jgi:hypothetical protein
MCPQTEPLPTAWRTIHLAKTTTYPNASKPLSLDGSRCFSAVSCGVPATPCNKGATRAARWYYTVYRGQKDARPIAPGGQGVYLHGSASSRMASSRSDRSDRIVAIPFTAPPTSPSSAWPISLAIPRYAPTAGLALITRAYQRRSLPHPTVDRPLVLEPVGAELVALRDIPALFDAPVRWMRRRCGLRADGLSSSRSSPL